jgi:trk system potassium uptake protein TrkH
MNVRGVLFLLGRLLLALAIVLLVPAVVAWALGGEGAGIFFLSAAITGVAGIASELAFRQRGVFSFGRREAFLLVSAAWVTASIVGALPYVLHKGPDFVVDALFESASGFTTTGATILLDVESEPRGLLLWRSLTQWLGGMGIIVLGIAILPKLDVGGMQLLGAEAPGPVTEKLTPRIAQTAKTLWGIYAALTALEAGVLMWLGMGWFDAINHALTSLATGGFSTRNASVGAFGSGAIELVVALFMILAGINFALHFKLLRGKPLALFRDSELRVYLFVLAAATVAIGFNLVLSGRVVEWGNALRLGLFQAATIVSTTGYATADFDAWPAFSRALLFALMFVGGCAGSTAGSVKVARAMIVVKKLAVELKRMVRPHAVLPVRFGRRAIPEEVVTSVTTFLLMYVSLFAAGGLVLAMFGIDLVTAYTAAAACLGNIGPGLEGVGPMQTYAPLPAPAKVVLIAMMLIGRLELYTMLVTLYLSRRLF